MRNFFHSLFSKLRGKNGESTPTPVIRDQLRERRALPIGRTEWEAFIDRIHSGHCIPGLSRDSVAFAVADQILHLGPLEDFKEDAFFPVIKSTMSSIITL